MSQAFAININQDDLRNVRTMLADFKGMPERVMMRSLNKTITGVKTDASTAIRKEITASKKAVDATFKLDKATMTKISAAIKSTGRPLPLAEFSARQTKQGVSTQVKKSKSRSIVHGTFIVTMKSGHTGVFWRIWHGGYKKKNPAVRYAALPTAYRLPMEELFGPRVPDIMGNEPVMKGILIKAGDRLHDNLVHETEYELSKHK